MWFTFGFITLISFSFYFWYKRVKATWSGTAGSSEGISFQYNVSKSKKGRIIGLLVGIDGPIGYDYSFKKETSFDRFFKSIGLSNEYQVGNKEFDDLVYIVSDNVEFHRQLSSNATIATSVIEIFKLNEKYNCEVVEICNNLGRLWVSYTTGDFDENSILDLSSETASILKIIANEIEHIPKIPNSKWKDPFVTKAAIILAINTGFAINGLFRLIQPLVLFPFMVDLSQLLIDSLCWGVGLIFIFVIIAIIVLGRSARTHLVLIELLIVGTFGFVSTSFFELRDINIEFDKSVAAEYEVKVLDKEIRKKKKSKRYYLYLNDWNRRKTKEKVKVSSDFYHSVSIRDDIIIKQREGYLEYRWVESVKRKI